MNILRKHKNDIVLIIIMIVVSIIFATVFFFLRETGGIATVSIDGKIVSSLPLNTNTEMTFGEGAHKNTLIIRDGKAYVTEASCPDHVCINRGEIQYEGETIVCLPNKFVVTIEGGEDNNNDSVAG